MELKEYRKEIDAIDAGIVELFARRMKVCAEIAEYKRMHDLPVLDAGREAEKLAALSQLAGPELAPQVRALYKTIFSVSRAYQRDLNGEE